MAVTDPRYGLDDISVLHDPANNNVLLIIRTPANDSSIAFQLETIQADTLACWLQAEFKP